MAEEPPVNRERVPLRKRLKRQWKYARRKVLGLSLRGLIPVLSLVPFPLSRRVWPFLTGFLARPLLRGKILRHLDLAYGEAMDPKQKRTIVRQICRNIGYSAAETLALYRGSLPHDSLHAETALASARGLMDEGKGLVLITAHMGNWEALGWHVVKALPDVPMAAIAKRNANPEIQKLAERTRQKTGMETFYQDDSPRAALRHLKKGGFLAVVPDQDMRALAGIFLPFFGRNAYTPIGPATLAIVSGSPLLVATSYRGPGGQLYAESFEVIRPRKGAPREEEVERITRAWSEQVEQSVRAHPTDWMWFHERWRTTPASLQARRDRLRTEFHEQRKTTGT